VLLICLTSILLPVWLRWAYQEYKTPASIAIRVIEVRNPTTTTKMSQRTGWRGFYYNKYEDNELLEQT